MSGGSWNYLCWAENIMERKEDIRSMAERLAKDGYPEIAKSFFDMYEELKVFEVRVSSWQGKYEGIMRAIEWFDSGDSSQEQVKTEADKLINHIKEQ